VECVPEKIKADDPANFLKPYAGFHCLSVTEEACTQDTWAQGEGFKEANVLRREKTDDKIYGEDRFVDCFILASA
jgi:hypothetical protein